MASCVRNICAKSRKNPLIILKLHSISRGPFLRHTVYLAVRNTTGTTCIFSNVNKLEYILAERILTVFTSYVKNVDLTDLLQ